MANPTVIVITAGVLLLGESQAEVSVPAGTGKAFQCQTSSAAINATPNLQTVPATFCAPTYQVPAATGYELALSWLQDWTVGPTPGGLSLYAYTNDTLQKWFGLYLTGAALPSAVGQCRVVAGAYGGDAGVPLAATATWPIVGKPTITGPATTVLSTGEEAPPEEEPASVAAF